MRRGGKRRSFSKENSVFWRKRISWERGWGKRRAILRKPYLAREKKDFLRLKEKGNSTS